MDYRTRKLRQTEIQRIQKQRNVTFVVLAVMVLAVAVVGFFVVKDYFDVKRCVNTAIGAEFTKLNCSEVLDLK